MSIDHNRVRRGFGVWWNDPEDLFEHDNAVYLKWQSVLEGTSVHPVPSSSWSQLHERVVKTEGGLEFDSSGA